MDEQSQAAKRRSLVLNLLGIAIIGFLVFSLGKKHLYDYNTYKNPAFGAAVILGVDTARIGKSSVRYKFMVNGQTYTSKCEFSDKSIFQIGDTCDIVYSSNNPRYSKALLNSDNTLMIKSKKN